MAFVTHFESPEGEKLPIAAGACYAIRIPAAGSADKGSWLTPAEGTTAHYNQLHIDADENSALIPSCTDQSVFTDHGLRIEYEEQLQGWVAWIDSLPEAEAVLHLLVLNAVEGGEL